VLDESLPVRLAEPTADGASEVVLGRVTDQRREALLARRRAGGEVAGEAPPEQD
jgi:hypothetical protein